jgi:two-component system sensor histidine kinase UhpB
MKRLRLLQVEDSRDDADLVVAELASAGFVVAAECVETARDMALALDEGGWDLILSDYNLPAFSADAALGLVKARGLDIPFIVVSGCVGDETAVALMRDGAHDFILKDNLSRLAPAVERELREARMRRDRKLDQQRIETSEKLLRDITSVLGEGLLVQDMEGRLMLMNPEAERLLGWTEVEFMGRDVHDTIHCRRADGSP